MSQRRERLLDVLTLIFLLLDDLLKAAVVMIRKRVKKPSTHTAW
jgi:hypothetical protein